MTDHPVWRTSSYSSDQGGNCVEVADVHGGRLVRDSKNRSGVALFVPASAWALFTQAVHVNGFD